MSKEGAQKSGVPNIIVSDYALKLAEKWVDEMSKAAEDEDEETEPQAEGRPPRLGLGAKLSDQMSPGASNRRIVSCSSGKSDDVARARPILSATSDKLCIFPAGSNYKLVNDLLEGIHLVAAVEAICLGIKAGIHPWIIYDIISNADGNSWIFKNHVPDILRGNGTEEYLLDFIQKSGFVLNEAKLRTFPVFLLSVAHQQLILASAHGHEVDGDMNIVKIWEEVYGVNIISAANEEKYFPEELAEEIVANSDPVSRIGFVGLGAMGFGMATHLLKLNYCVSGFDVCKPTLKRFAKAGGLIAKSPAKACKDVDVLVIMVTNEAEAERVLYGDRGAILELPSGASIILSSTVSPGFVNQLEQRLQREGKDLKLVDAPVSGGVKRAAEGTLTIMASGSDAALKSTGSVLSALSEELYIIKGGCGAGSVLKMVNQLLAGVHIASSAEAMAFGAHLRFNRRTLFDAITNSTGSSWMFENRVPHMLDNDYTPYSALDIFVKDLGIVSRECSSRKVPLHIATVAHQLFVAGSAAGWGRHDGAGVVKVYETLTRVKVEAEKKKVNVSST